MKLYLCVYEYGGYDYCMPDIHLIVAESDEEALQKAVAKTGLRKVHKWDVDEVEVPGYQIEVKSK